jgi:hypothetical protein
MSVLSPLVGRVKPPSVPSKPVEVVEEFQPSRIKYQPGRIPELLPALPGEPWHAQYVRSALADGRFGAL